MGILEIHLHEPSVDFAPSVGGETPSESGVGVDFGGDEEDGSGGGGRAMLGVLALLGVALAVRRLRRSRPAEAEYERPPTP